jgi:glycosyltransferase involved in cell wall biosynthesis
VAVERSRAELSVVIPFRDWGLARLIASIRLHQLNSWPLRTEIIVSDYGSADAGLLKEHVEAVGGRVVRSDASSLPWSRSAALNAGVEHAMARSVITTDADILFAPQCYYDAFESLRSEPSALYLIQCRDLPQSHDVRFFESILEAGAEVDFDDLIAISTLRPRWGMGGFAAFTVASFFRLNGYDERMKIWGAEDADFAKRFRLARMPVRWLNRNGANVFHIWHPSSQARAKKAEETRSAVELNRQILFEEHTSVRNLTRLYRQSDPVISIIIPAYKRPDYLKLTLRSCQAQTFPNFEVLVVENGDSDACEGVCRAFDDHRIRYIKTEKAGAGAARNVGSDEARGHYIVIQDDDDMMVSSRLERHLAALREGNVHGTYCGWIDFDDEDGRPVGFHPGKEHSFPAMLAQGRVIVHAGLMVEASILREFRYDETRTAGIDFALLLSLTCQGLKLAHTGSYGLLRRLHPQSMTAEKSAVQKESGREGVRSVTQHLSEAERNELKAIGRKASLLSCDNEDHALKELALYMAGEAPLPTIPERAGCLSQGGAAIDAFDADWYLAAYPDVKATGMDAAYHYRKYGVLLGRARNASWAESASLKRGFASSSDAKTAACLEKE